jgi:hypothetical protein
MPPRHLAISPLTHGFSSRQTFKPIYFSGCCVWRIAQGTTQSLPRSSTTVRHAGTISPASAINAPLNVSPSHLELYNSLDALKRDAANYTNLSRCQLTLKGLELGDPVVRVALLGIGNARQAKNLARILIADPLAEEESWEKSLENGLDDGRAILLRYRFGARGNAATSPLTSEQLRRTSRDASVQPSSQHPSYDLANPSETQFGSIDIDVERERCRLGCCEETAERHTRSLSPDTYVCHWTVLTCYISCP